MIRNNEDRFGPHASGGDEVDNTTDKSVLQFITPTEFVELPSSGNGYPLGHPLFQQEAIEIRYMTAKDEDILTSRSLLKSGMAIDRLISNLIVDKNINPGELLMGDRNAIIIAARASAYGHEYKTSVSCPSCGHNSKWKFNLSEPDVYSGDEWEDYDIRKLENGNYMITLPRTEFNVEVKLLTGKEETKYLKQAAKKRRKDDETVTQQMKLYIVSIEGHNSQKVINHFLENAPASESRYLRSAVDCITPKLKITEDFECPSCGHEQELEVPLGADFFWPER